MLRNYYICVKNYRIWGGGVTCLAQLGEWAILDLRIVVRAPHWVEGFLKK